MQKSTRILWAIFLTIITICATLFICVVNTDHKIKALYIFQQKALDIESDVLYLRKQEKSFLLYPSESTTLLFNNKYQQLYKKTTEIDFTEQAPLPDELKLSIRTYKQTFDELVALQRQIGFSETEGQQIIMREYAHQTEALINKLKNDDLYKDLLQLRRNEKDFIVRHDNKYIELFKQNFLHIQTEIAVEIPHPEVLLKTLLAYSDAFQKLAVLMYRKGFSPDEALLYKLQTQANNLDTAINKILKFSKSKTNKDLHDLTQVFYILILLSGITLFTFILILVKRINKEHKQLINSEHQFRLLSESLPALVAQGGALGYCQYLNQAWENFSGLSRNMLKGYAWQQCIYPDDKQQWNDLVAKNVDTDRHHSTFEMRLKNNQGQYRWILFTLRTDVISEKSTFVLTGTDITQQKIIQEQLDHSLIQQKIINNLLAFPVNNYSMKALLHRSLVIILAAPFLSFKSIGAIFTADIAHKTLTLAAHIGLPADIQLLCASVGYEQCPCGRAALSEQLIHTLYCDKQHKTCSPHQEDHGHYSVPILSNGTLLGVISFYLESGHAYNKNEADYLKTAASTLAKLIERKQINLDLELANMLFNHSNQSLIVTDSNATIIKVNKNCERITAYTQAELIGNSPKILQAEPYSGAFYDLQQILETKGQWEGEIITKCKTGKLITQWLSISCIKGSEHNEQQYVAIATDLTPIKVAERRIEKLAYYDTLTGLANRALLYDHINLSIAQSNRQKIYFSLLFMDLDHFKNVNDSLGHSAGDKLLREISNRIQVITRSSDTVARFGGDEFVILLNDFSHSKEETSYLAQKVAEKILLSLSESIKIEQKILKPSVSIGISIFPDTEQSLTVDDLIKQADIAMYHAKAKGRNRYQFYLEEMNKNITERLQLESLMRDALVKEEFELYYQPQVNAITHKIIGAEVLLRWKNSELGFISPADFIPIAEETGQIIEIGRWVLQQACLQIVAWLDAGVIKTDFGHIAINVSPVQFREDNFIVIIQDILQNTQVPAALVEIEVTESALQDDLQEVTEKLKQLKALGLFIAIDDFGTGYSSLSRLKNFPIDLIKIDKSFVDDIVIETSDKAIIKAIIAMAQGLGIPILAEGVETQGQRDLLIRKGCLMYQGYLYSKPVSATDFQKLLEAPQNYE